MSRRRLVATLTLVPVLGALVGVRLASGAGLTVANKGVIAYKVCTLTGVTNNTAVTDAHVREGNKNNNYDITALSIAAGKNVSRRTFIRFDLTKCSPAVPAAATLVGARLRLMTSATNNRTIEIHRVTATWSETGVTWNNQPTVAAAATATTLVNAVSVYFEWNVLPDVTAFLAGPSSNYGWRVRDSGDGSGTEIQTTFHSSEVAASTTGRPQLVISYRP